MSAPDITTSKINNIEVKPVVALQTEAANKLFFFDNVNCALLSPTRGGKSTVLSHILKTLVKPPTDKLVCHVFVFSPTIDQHVYQDLHKWFEERDIDAQFYKDFDTNTDCDGSEMGALDQAIDMVLNPPVIEMDEEDEEDVPVEGHKGKIRDTNVVIGFGEGHKIGFGGAVPPKKKVKKPPPVHKFFIVIDDQGDKTRDARIGDFAIKSRHYNCSLFVAVQWIKYLNTDTRNNLTNIILFAGAPCPILKGIWEEMNLQTVPWQLFTKIYYKMIKKDKFDFLYCDKLHMQLRKNFNEVINWEPVAKMILEKEIQEVVGEQSGGSASPASAPSSELNTHSKRPRDQNGPRRTEEPTGYLIH